MRRTSTHSAILALILASGLACSTTAKESAHAEASEEEDSTVASDVPSESFDHTAWDRVLKRHVTRGEIHDIQLTAVDYQALAQGDSDYELYLRQLAEADLTGLNRAEQLALWINVYNVFAIKMVVHHLPLRSIKDAGGMIFGKVWDKEAGTVAGKVYTLNQIENEILRKMDEPRIHAAIVCASVSCPDLRPEAFVTARLEEQLTEQMSLWLANPKKGLKLDPDGDTLYLSSIFNWFGKDFKKASGTVVDYVLQYAPEDVRESIEKNKKKLHVRYFDYDWDLNSKQTAEIL